MRKNKSLWYSLALLAAYLLLGYVAGPWLLQPRLQQYVASHFGRELRFERLHVDPLTWSVQLKAVDLVAGGQSLWPGVSMSAGKAELRFSFWSLAPVVSELTLQAPRLVLNTGAEQLQSGRYPFVGLWQQWQQDNETVAGSKLIPIKKWRLETGQFLTSVSSPATEEVVLDDIFLQADPQNPDGMREYSLAFSVAGQANISSQGLFSPEDLQAMGQYQLKMANAEAGSTAGLEVAGAVATELLNDQMLIELSESQLSAERFSGCLLDGLLCAAVTPLQAGFESRLSAATDGLRVLQADARLNAFQLDASLGQGRVGFADQRRFYGAQIELGPPDGAAEGANQSFILWLNGSDTSQYQIEGRMNLQAQAAEARFRVSGRQNMSGEMQLQRVGRQQAQAAPVQLALQLENPGAGLAQEFMNEHFTNGFEARSLQLQLTASIDGPDLRLQENISLENARLMPAPQIPEAEPGTTLDANWLIALLQDPNDRIEVGIPELTVDSTTRASLDELVQRQALMLLTELSDQPFAGLARALQVSNQNLNRISFAAGSAALDAGSTKTITDLARILLQRPRLGISMAGVYDPVLDKQALQTEQVRTHIALAMAADLAFRTGAEPPDFSDPIVHSVIEEFAERQLPADAMQAFVEQFGQADADQGVLPEGDAAAYYSTLFELLVDNAEIPQGAMTTLARFRAQAVMDALEDEGVSRDRLAAASQATSSETREGGVPLSLQLRTWPGENADLAPGAALPTSP